MGVQERKARHKEELRREILEAARDLFVKEGYRNVSMRRVAERIEYSPTTIYLHFKDKMDLLFHLSEETFSQLVEAQERLKQLGLADPVASLRRELLYYIDFGLQNPNHYKLAFMTEVDEDPIRFCAPESMGMRSYGYLRESVENCIKAGRFKVTDTETATQAIWSAVHGFVALQVVMPTFEWADKEGVAKLLVDRLLAGFEA